MVRKSPSGQLLADGRLVDTLGTVQLSLQLGSDSYYIQHEMVVAAVEAPAVIGLDFYQGHGCILDIQKGTLAVPGKVHTCQAMRDMPAILRIYMIETASVGASQTFSASLSGLNIAEYGGICCMKAKNLRIEGSSPSWLYEQNLMIEGWSPSLGHKWTGLGVRVTLDGTNGQDRGFESLQMVWMNRIEGSSLSWWYAWTGSRVWVSPDGMNEQDRGFESLLIAWMNRIEGSSPSR